MGSPERTRALYRDELPAGTVSEHPEAGGSNPAPEGVASVTTKTDTTQNKSNGQTDTETTTTTFIEPKYQPVPTRPTVPSTVRDITVNMGPRGPIRRAKRVNWTNTLSTVTGILNGIVSRPGFQTASDILTRHGGAPVVGAATAFVATPIFAGIRRWIGNETYTHAAIPSLANRESKNPFIRFAARLEGALTHRNIFGSNNEEDDLLTYVNADGTVNTDLISATTFDGKYWKKLASRGYHSAHTANTMAMSGIGFTPEEHNRLQEKLAMGHVADRILEIKFKPLDILDYKRTQLDKTIRSMDNRKWLGLTMRQAASNAIKAGTGLALLEVVTSNTFGTLVGKLKAGAEYVFETAKNAAVSAWNSVNAGLTELSKNINNTVQTWKWPWEQATQVTIPGTAPAVPSVVPQPEPVSSHGTLKDITDFVTAKAKHIKITP